MRKLGASIKKRIDRLFYPRYRVVRRYGSRLLLDNRNWIDARILIRKPYENEQLDTCARLIEQYKIDTFIDIGANFGLYSIVLNQSGKLATTYAFEPVTRNHDQLCANIFINELTHKVIPVKKAASDKVMTETIHISPGSTGVSRLSLAHSGRDNAVFTDQEIIQTCRLDDELPLTGQRLLIKLDVEGHEMAALAGMQNILKTNQACLQVEAFGEARLQEVDTFFNTLNYHREGAIGSDYRYSNFPQ